MRVEGYQLPGGKGSRGRVCRYQAQGLALGESALMVALWARRPRGFRSAEPRLLRLRAEGKEGPSRPKALDSRSPADGSQAEDRRGGRILRSEPPRRALHHETAPPTPSPGVSSVVALCSATRSRRARTPTPPPSVPTHPDPAAVVAWIELIRRRLAVSFRACSFC